MMMNTKVLSGWIDDVLKKRAFSKRRYTWYRHHPETILVLDLQKSDYSGQYYVNLAVALRGLNPEEFPSEERCHIRIRLDKVIDDQKTVLTVFDLENRALTDNERCQQIREMIGRGSQWLEELATPEAIARRLSSNESLRNRTTVQARRFLNIK